MRLDNITGFMLLPLVALLFAACEDEWDTAWEEYVEGTANMHVTIAFDRETSVQLQTRAVGGDKGESIQDINSFCMVVYKPKDNNDGNTEWELQGLYPVYGCDTKHNDVSNVKYERDDNRIDEEKEEKNQDASSGKLEFDLKLHSGKYLIYGVANMGKLERRDYSTPEQLKSIELEWKDGDAALNNQMFGVFSLEPDRNAYYSKKQEILVSAKTKTIHCWLLRLASKITVAFDGSELYDDVNVFIETITLKDIPRKCTLGMDNEPGKGLDGKKKEDREKVLMLGKTVTIQPPVESDGHIITPDNFIHVCNNAHKYMDGNTDSVLNTVHNHSSEHSLFFYENMQGEGKSKKQSQDGVKIDYPDWKENDDKSGWKDNKPFGTYIEVKGYYQCVARDGASLSSGPITYRFMLGQDTDKDYNAKRNTHYKLTLKLKGYANDYDWHIDYVTEPGLYIVSPQYISYLYNKKMMAHLRIVGEIDPDDPHIYATIVGNEKAELSEFPEGAKVGIAAEETDKDKIYWQPWGDGSEDFPTIPSGVVAPGTTTNDGPWNSFLSLRQINVIKITPPGYGNAASHLVPESTDYNKTYWNKNDKGWRIYDLKNPEGDSSISKDGVYTVNHVGSEYVLVFPLYTRAKELVTKTGFTGNNPYFAHPRKMKVRFSAHMKGSDGYKWKHVYLDVIQVRRIENPKGVWRKAGSTEPFHVTLMRLPEQSNEQTVDYKSFKSVGKWSAEVVKGGDNIITLSTTPDGSGANNKPQHYMTRIEGESEHPIDFQINFNGSEGFAIVKVRYHNYTCEHDIFCRNGYGDVDINDDGIKWSSFNVHHFENGDEPVLTQSPIEGGSLFRRGSYIAILEENDGAIGTALSSYQVMMPDGSKTSKGWSEVAVTKAQEFWKIDSKKADSQRHIATIEDYNTLISTYPDAVSGITGDDLDYKIKKAYGVVYADGATKVQNKFEDATGYNREKDDRVESPKGMRGVIVYNRENHKQLFLPVGKTGYGRRKAENGAWAPKPRDPDGGLRYASRNKVMSGAREYTPLFYDLYKRPGAIYWCERWLDNRNENLGDPKSPYIQNTAPTGGSQIFNVRKSSALDINYFTMGFEGYENNASYNTPGNDTLTGFNNSDAAYIRTVTGRRKSSD